MKRFFIELFRPYLKCVRVGHKIKKRKVAIRFRDPQKHYILVEHEAVLSHCSRCSGEHNLDLGKYICGFNSVSMPDEIWDILRKQEYIIDRNL